MDPASPAPSPDPNALAAAGLDYHAARSALAAGEATRAQARAAELSYLGLLAARPDPQALHPVEAEPGVILGARPHLDGNGLHVERIEAAGPPPAGPSGSGPIRAIGRGATGRGAHG